MEFTAEQLNVIVGGLLIMFASIAGGFGNAIVVSQFVKGVARQPEAANTLTTRTIIGVALVEVVPIIGVAMGILKLLNIL